MDRTEKKDTQVDIFCINGYITDDKLNQDDVLLVHSTNAIGCKIYGISSDLVKKYPFCDIAGLRYPDMDLKYVAREQDRSEEGACYTHVPALYGKGPKIATLITQYGFGNPYEENKLSQKIVRSCEEESFTRHLRMDTIDNRLIHSNRSLFFFLATLMKQEEYTEVEKIILPIGIGRGAVDEIWLNRYYSIITKFIHEINFYGKMCYFLAKKSYFKAINNYVTRNCSEKAISVIEELKSIPWKDIDKAWYNELIQDKQVDLLDLVKLGSVSCSEWVNYL